MVSDTVYPVRIENSLPSLAALRGEPVMLGCGRLEDGIGDTFLVPVESSEVREVSIPESELLRLPAGLDADRLELTLPLAVTLNSLNDLGIELGTTLICTGGHAFSQLAALAAGWRGAIPVVALTDKGDTSWPPGVEILDTADPERALETLKQRLEKQPDVAVLELSGRAEIVDICFEAIPYWARMMLAADSSEPVTIDFYNNLHRKGVVLSTGSLDLQSLYGLSRTDLDRLLTGADRLLVDVGRAKLVRQFSTVQ